MDWSLKPCTATTCTTTTTTLCAVQNDYDVSPLVDRLTSLPDELLIQILSLLPTKAAAATSILSSNLRRVFPLITSLEFDLSPISLCLKHPYAVERFPNFVTFVDNVLFAYKSNYLTRFRLRVGMDLFTRYYDGCRNRGYYELGCQQGCLPDLKFAHLHAWISFPLTLYGLRELDLCILVRDPGDGQLPPAIFTCETLEVLKLEVNLGLDQVCTTPSSRLPKLKLLRLCASFIADDDFLPRLVFSCPLLEDLTFEAITKHVHRTAIRSPSLRTLCLTMHKDPAGFGWDNSDIVYLHVPNLEYLEYTDNLALEYSIPIMHRLVEARLCLSNNLFYEPAQVSFRNVIKLLRPMYYVQRLTLFDLFLRELDCDEVKDELPVFPYLNHLTLDCAPENYFWDKILWAFLNCSPVLETLVFDSGLSDYFEEENYIFDVEDLKPEREFFGTAHAIPSCCRYHLKRIVINIYFGIEREVAIIQFLLRHALVLEELVVCRFKSDLSSPLVPDQMSAENKLKNLPRASATCSIKVL